MRLSLTLITILLSFVANASTNISGQIRSNTTWTKAGSPYVLTGKVEIAPNVTLTVDAGVMIEMDEGIDVYGSILLNATATDSIYLYTPKKGNNRKYITIKSSSFVGRESDTFRLHYCNFWNTNIFFEKGAQSLLVSECTFAGQEATFVVWFGARNTNFIVKNNQFFGGVFSSNDTLVNRIEVRDNKFLHYSNTGWAISIASHANNDIVIENNYFDDNFVCVYMQTASLVKVLNNTFINNTVGISDSRQGGTNYLIQGNVFTKNTKAIESKLLVSKNTEISNNSIYQNEIGIEIFKNSNTTGTAGFKIENNCIYDNEKSVNWGTDHDIAIGANWWGTTNTAQIDSAIYDYYDDFKIGKVTYMPLLSQKDSSCKVLNPTTIAETSLKGNQIKVFPNPFSEVLNISTDVNAKISKVELFDIVGKCVVYINDFSSSTATVNTINIPDGVYIYKITFADNSSTTGKLLK